MKKSKKIIFAAMMTLLAVLIIYIIYFFFGAKKYTFYMKDNSLEIQAIALLIEGDVNQELDSREFVIYDRDVINDIMKELKTVKMKPDFSMSESGNGQKVFSIRLLGENNQQLYYLAGEGNNCYLVNIGTEDNGTVDEGMKHFIGQTSISKKNGDKLYDLIKQTLEENISHITVSDLEKISEEKTYNWNTFQQYLYTEDVDAEARTVTRGEMTSAGAARFQIEGKKGYLVVWFYNGILVDEEEIANRYAEVTGAIVYNGEGEEMNLYEDGISTFLEEME